MDQYNFKNDETLQDILFTLGINLSVAVFYFLVFMIIRCNRNKSARYDAL